MSRVHGKGGVHVALLPDCHAHQAAGRIDTTAQTTGSHPLSDRQYPTRLGRRQGQTDQPFMPQALTTRLRLYDLTTFKILLIHKTIEG